MKVKKEFVLRNIAGSDIVIPIAAVGVDFNGMITLNESAAFLWRKLENDTDVEGLVSALLAEYEVDEPTARTCVKEYIAKLEEIGCLE
ncbi:MAG: PqqD family protein [Ruminococcaceae bacterium]|nr:PqqD family protein [Oscillospiraceae bacterium]